MLTLRRARTAAILLALTVVIALISAGSGHLIRGPSDRVRQFTRPIEFEYVGWTAEALAGKLRQLGLGATSYLPEADRQELVLEYLALLGQAGHLERQLEATLGDPNLASPEAAAGPIAADLAGMRVRLNEMRPTAEAVLQENLTTILDDMGIGVEGAPLPPVSFQFSELPMALIVSPRSEIRQDANIQLLPDLTLEEQMALERIVEEELDVSALVVPIGGLSTYPTMIMESGAIDWVAETVAHEWVHHYLAFRPLGVLYTQSGDMRTINETAANLAGNAIGRELLARYFPEHLPPEPAPAPDDELGPTTEPPEFDFRAEMHETRLRVDELLAEERIEEAEDYMEQRRQVFWDQGHRHIRRLNQAYFAFHGAYADQPGGPSGEDPAAAAVRALWVRSENPIEFLRKIAWVTSLESLQELVRS